MPYWDTVGTTDHPTTNRWAAFVHAFIMHFGDPQAEAKAESRLKTLQQTTSVTEYISRFNILQAKVRWDEISLIFHFKSGLKAEVIRFGSTIGWPRTLEAVKQAAVPIDEGLMIAQAQERRTAQQTYQPPYRPPQRQQGNAAEAVVQTQKEADGNVGTVYQSRKRGPLSLEEKKQRRDEGLCLYCGGANHIAENWQVASA